MSNFGLNLSKKLRTVCFDNFSFHRKIIKEATTQRQSNAHHIKFEVDSPNRWSSTTRCLCAGNSGYNFNWRYHTSRSGLALSTEVLWVVDSHLGSAHQSTLTGIIINDSSSAVQPGSLSIFTTGTNIRQFFDHPKFVRPTPTTELVPDCRPQDYNVKKRTIADSKPDREVLQHIGLLWIPHAFPLDHV